MSGTTEVVDLYARAVENFRDVVELVPDEAWTAPTPCADWDVRALVNHVVGEDRWVVPLLEGKTVADVGDALDGDLLGAAPEAAAATAGTAAIAALAEPGATARTVHLSFGDFTAEEYAWQVLADHVVHTWDLLVAIGAPRELEPRLVEVTTGWWDAWEDAYRDAGAVGPAVPVAVGSPPQERLLASFGRDPSWTPVHDVVRRFDAAWEAWDMELVLSMLAPDAVFESTGPAPDGRRLEGIDAIGAEWLAMAEATRDPAFTFEEAIVCGDRATTRWRFGWTNEDGSAGHVRGVDVIRVAGGRVTEKFSYVKG